MVSTITIVHSWSEHSTVPSNYYKSVQHEKLEKTRDSSKGIVLRALLPVFKISSDFVEKFVFNFIDTTFPQSNCFLTRLRSRKTVLFLYKIINFSPTVSDYHRVIKTFFFLFFRISYILKYIILFKIMCIIKFYTRSNFEGFGV